MKTDDFSETMLQLQTINECQRMLPEIHSAHSNDKPGVPSLTTHISVRFVPLSIFQPQIKKLHESRPTPE